MTQQDMTQQNTEYLRTAFKRLEVSGYRSLAKVVLEDIPPLVVLHGPNGSGKSNLLRAMRLLLQATTIRGEYPVGEAHARTLPYSESAELLDLRPDDFCRGGIPAIRISAEIALGNRAHAAISAGDRQLESLVLSVRFEDPGDGFIRYWFDRSNVDGNLELAYPPDHDKREAHNKMEALRAQHERHVAQEKSLLEQENALLLQDQTTNTITSLTSVRSSLVDVRVGIRKIRAQIDKVAPTVGPDALIQERIRHTFLRASALYLSDAYRRPDEDFARRLFNAFVSEKPGQRDAVRRLASRLGEAGIFNMKRHSVAIQPIISRTFREHQVLFQHPSAGELPLRNLGTGEQQLIMMLSQQVITPSPIAQVEEPEAHLHVGLMKPLAKLLRQAVLPPAGPPDVDQLWLATHHHLFTIASEYYDVRLDDEGHTVIAREPRAKAGIHFYEPGPLWDALRSLAESGLDKDAVLFRDAQGNPVHAEEVLHSMDTGGDLAVDYVEAATRAMVLAMKKRADSDR